MALPFISLTSLNDLDKLSPHLSTPASKACRGPAVFVFRPLRWSRRPTNLLRPTAERIEVRPPRQEHQRGTRAVAPPPSGDGRHSSVLEDHSPWTDGQFFVNLLVVRLNRIIPKLEKFARDL